MDVNLRHVDRDSREYVAETPQGLFSFTEETGRGRNYVISLEKPDRTSIDCSIFRHSIDEEFQLTASPDAQTARELLDYRDDVESSNLPDRMKKGMWLLFEKLDGEPTR